MVVLEPDKARAHPIRDGCVHCAVFLGLVAAGVAAWAGVVAVCSRLAG